MLLYAYITVITCTGPADTTVNILVRKSREIIATFLAIYDLMRPTDCVDPVPIILPQIFGWNAPTSMIPI